MPASYVHQSIANTVCDRLHCYYEKSMRDIVLAGAEGPDPLFYCFLIPQRYDRAYAPTLASAMHRKKTNDFLIALLGTSSESPVLTAYSCGFLTHYAADTIVHPYVYAHSITPDGKYSSNLHSTLEQHYDIWQYRHEGHQTGIPTALQGICLLNTPAMSEISNAFSYALGRVFPDKRLTPKQVAHCFRQSIRVSRWLHSPDGKKYALAGRLPSKLRETVHAHMVPGSPWNHDFLNHAHASWHSIWQPDIPRTESLPDLYQAAVERACYLLQAGQAYMKGHLTETRMRLILGDLSYDSGLPWQESISPYQAADSLSKNGLQR